MELKLTENFSFNELTDTAKGELRDKNRADAVLYLQNLVRLAKELQRVRNFFGSPVTINSGFRCPDLNAAVGGAPNSNHTRGVAADFTVEGFKDGNGLLFVFEWCRNHLAFEELIYEHPEGRSPWIHLAVCEVGAASSPKPAVKWDGSKYEVA